ncbi:MAG: ABC transporter ATP-binding protein, partial [Pyrinomonadaceae bacterium]
GKTTLLQILGGLDAADSGSVCVCGTELTELGVGAAAEFRRARVGFVFQFHHLLPALNAWENVALPLLVARRPRREARARALDLLAAVGLSERAAHLPGEMSGGEQQRAALARALVHDPRIVLADEPTGNLDARNAEEVGALFFALCRERGAAVLVATHNERLALRCDRILLLEDGRLEERGRGERDEIR